MNLTETCNHLQEYALSKDGKAIFSIIDKELVKELREFFPIGFKYKTTQLTTKKMGALLLLKEQGKEEPVCECCGNSLEDKFPWRDNQTTEERTTIFGSWPRTCSLVCNQKLIKQEGKRDQTLIDRYGTIYPTQNETIRNKISKPKSNTDYTQIGINQQKRRLLQRGVLQEFVDSIDFTSDESKANALIKVAEKYKGETGKDANRYILARLTGMHKTLINRWLQHVPSASHLYRSGTSVSAAQIEIKEYIESLGEVAILSDRTIIYPLEFDIYIPSHNLAIEYNGIWVHSENYSTGKDRNYHVTKTNMADAKGINLLQVYDVEWNDPIKQEIWKSIIKHKLNLTENKIHARKCIMKEISSKDAELFLDENHLQGFVRTSNYLGLTYNDILVSVVAYGKSRFDKNSTEIIRMATKVNTIVVGSVSKFLSHIKKETDLITCFADRRYSSILNCGYNNGLVFDTITEPNWWVFSKKEYYLHSRFQFMKHKLEKILPIFDKDKTAFENMIDNGYDRIWDSGNLKFCWKK